MGSYMNTCLSLPDGCYAYSVRANAYDANKQVLYVRDSAGRVLARQLVAINSGFRFVGYGVYDTFGDDDGARWEGTHRALAAYCGRWARDIGLKLANKGDPESILDNEWYDDIVCSWHEAAPAAWEQRDATASKPAAPIPPLTDRVEAVATGLA